MGKGYAAWEVSSEHQRMWRLLLARLHPDAGGDQELFVFARGLRDQIRGELRAVPAPRALGGPEHPFHEWRTTMASWAYSNRASLRDPREGVAPDAADGARGR